MKKITKSTTGKIKLVQEETTSLPVRSGVKAGAESFKTPVSFKSSFVG
jgi:hypothetical protein